MASSPAQHAGGPGLGEGRARARRRASAARPAPARQRRRSDRPRLFQGFQADRFEAGFESSATISSRRGGSVVAHLADDLRRLGCDERRPAGQDLIEDGAQAVHVGPLVNQVVATLGLLGCHVRRRSEKLALHGALGPGPRVRVGPAGGPGVRACGVHCRWPNDDRRCRLSPRSSAVATTDVVQTGKRAEHSGSYRHRRTRSRASPGRNRGSPGPAARRGRRWV